jgi:hypothetical protein
MTNTLHRRPGRPTLDPDGGHAVRMHVSVRGYHWTALSVLAAEHGVPMSRLLRDIIDDWLWQVMGEEPIPTATGAGEGGGEENAL